jgi:hypothetical protein
MHTKYPPNALLNVRLGPRPLNLVLQSAKYAVLLSPPTRARTHARHAHASASASVEVKVKGKGPGYHSRLWLQPRYVFLTPTQRRIHGVRST